MWTSMSKRCGKPWKVVILSALLLLSLISATGCGQRYVVVQGGEKVLVEKAAIDKLYQDNELLTQALIECMGKK